MALDWLLEKLPSGKTDKMLSSQQTSSGKIDGTLTPCYNLLGILIIFIRLCCAKNQIHNWDR
ncbi:Uncharacterised protein [Legionella donaldsonii]|uniref:Uncharacterized protein n=1 Tax=Legionella donaldsonii TaxID=45060 RepID=A0A378IZY9_9GAMM|nr:Uncharacterised protein [Legionella donaldsonii]